MGGTGEGIAAAEAGAEVRTGTVAMKIVLMGVGAGGTMIVSSMKVEAGGTEAQVKAIGGVEAEAEAQVAGGIVVVLLGEEVKRDGLKLSSGTGKRKRQNVRARQMLVARIVDQKLIEVGQKHSRMDMGISDVSTGLFSLFLSPPYKILTLFVHSENFCITNESILEI